MLGNSLINFSKNVFGKKNWWDTLSENEQKKYSHKIDVFNDKSVQKDFNFDKWKNFSTLPEEVQEYFKTVDKGKATQEGLNKAMSKTMQVTDASGEAFVSSGSKIKDFGKKAKDGISTFGKSVGTGLKGVLKTAVSGIGGGLLNVGINLLIGTLINSAISAWQKYSNVQENAIAKSSDAVSKLQANQNKIKSAEEVLSSIKENKVIDSSGNEITRFEQLSQGVNSLGENISLTKSEFEEYNSILDAMSNAGLTATTSMAGLEAQVKQIRKSSNIDSLKGLNDWVDGFNAQNNQLYTDHTKEIGYQQKLNALDKIIGKDGKKPPKIDTQSSWDTLSANLAATNELRAAWDSYEGTNAKEHIEKAKKINKDTELKKTEKKALQQIAKEYDIDILDEKGNFSYKKYSSDEVQNQLKDAKQQLETQADSMAQQSAGFLQAMFENSPAFDSVSKSAANAIGSIFSNIDYETVSKNMLDSNGNLSSKLMKDWVKDLSFNLQDKNIQEKLSQLFNLDSNTHGQTFSEYKRQAESLIKDISSAIPQLSENLLKDSTGIKDILDNASASYNRVVETVGKDFADTLSVKDLELAAEIISEQDVQNAEELSHALKEAKLGEDAKNSFEAFSSSISEATANLETLKSTLSESVSGSGISSENLQAFREMFGDNAEKALERTANGYHINQKALAELQQQQNEALKTDYLSSLNKQYDQLRKVNEDLAKTAIMGGDVSGLLTQKAGIEAQIESLKDLQYQYEAANSAYQKWVNAQAGANERNMYENIQSGYEGVKDLIERGWVDDDVRTYVDLLSSADLSTANAEEVIEAYNQLGKTIGNSGHSILDFFTVDENGKSTTDGIYNFFDTVKSVLGEEYASFEDGKYKFNFGEGRDQEVAKALGMDVEAVQSILRAASEAGFEIHLDQPIASLEELKTSAETAKETLNGLNDTSLSDIDLDSTSLEDVDSQIQKVQEHISSLDPNVQTEELEAANDILEYLVQKKEELSKTTDIQFNLNNEEVLEKLSNANEKLKELGKTDVTFDFEANVDEIGSQVEKATSLLEQFKNEDGTVDLSIEGAQEAVDILQALLTRKEQLNQPAVMKVDSSQVEGDLGSAIGKIQEFQQAINDLNIAQDLKNAGVDIDTSAAQAKVQELAGDIQGLDGNVKASLGLNTEEFNSAIEAVKSQSIDINAGLNPESIATISSSLASITPEIMVNAGIDPTLVDSYSPTDKEAKVTFHVNSEEVDAWTAPNKEATLTYNITTSGSLPGDKERTLTYTIKTEGSVDVNGTAHANGTSGNANASGNWGVKKGGTSLVGELGTEILVRGSEFHTIGDNGAEFIETKPGDIIFNHKQTEALLENGYVTGRGKLIGGNAHVDGTAYSHGSGGLGRPSRPSTGMGSSSSNKDKNNSSSKNKSSNKKSSSSSSSATDDAKEFEEALDWIEIKIDRLERKIKSLDRIAGSAFETYATRSKALAEQMGEVSNEITVQQQAYERYLQQANSISLSDDYKTQVQNGTIDISTITDEDLKKNIDEYQQW